jgi:outer membrane lipoprotein-sorting protein
VSAFLRRLSLARLLVLCGAALAFAVGVSALALALGLGPTPPPEPLAQAVHGALAAPPVEGVNAHIQFTSHLIEGTSLGEQPGGQSLTSNPLLSGASGRLWISAEGKVRLELEAEQGDTEIVYDGHTLSVYEPASNTLYRYTPAAGEQGSSPGTPPSDSSAGDEPDHTHHIPTVEQIEETISHIMRHADLSGAIPTNVAGQPAYSVRISPKEDGGLVGGAELAWDAARGVPLQLAVYSTTSSTPVLELAATEISYGPVPDSVFAFTPPPGAKVTEVDASSHTTSSDQSSQGAAAPGQDVHGVSAVQAALPFTLDAPATLDGMARDEVHLISEDHHDAALISYGKGLGGITVVEGQVKPEAAQSESASQLGPSSQSMLGELPSVTIEGSKATEVPTALGTLLSFKRSGVGYLLAGSVTPTAIEAAGRGL